MLVFALTIVLVLGGTQPDVTIIHAGIFSQARCEELVRSFNGMDPDITDQVTGRPVIMTFNKCVPMDAEVEAKAYNDALKGNL